MAAGFRKSLFGFNTEDVLEYINKTHRNFSKKETEFNDKIADLEKEITLSKQNFENLAKEKAALEIELAAFRSKQDEIRLISENIGKLYLVAQANAKAVMNSSVENAELVNKETQKNMEVLSEAHLSLDSLQEEIKQTTESFVTQMEELLASLNNTKNQISENRKVSNDAENEFAEVYTAITE